MYTMLRNFFFRNIFLKNYSNKKKSLIVIHKDLKLTDIKVKDIPFKERYETIDF
jgi:hypothetical protein